MNAPLWTNIPHWSAFGGHVCLALSGYSRESLWPPPAINQACTEGLVVSSRGHTVATETAFESSHINDIGYWHETKRKGRTEGDGRPVHVGCVLFGRNRGPAWERQYRAESTSAERVQPVHHSKVHTEAVCDYSWMKYICIFAEFNRILSSFFLSLNVTYYAKCTLMSFIHTYVSPVCKETHKVSENTTLSLFLLTHLSKNQPVLLQKTT